MPERPSVLPFSCTLGVTGHRAERLPDPSAVTGQIVDALALLRQRAAALRAAEGEWFAPGPPRLTLLSPLADGADELAAEAALAAGWELRAVLPFARDAYLADFADEAARARHRGLLARAADVLELPGARADARAAYAMAGRATVAASDWLLAVWDGEPPRGPGGTAEVVARALTRGLPVIHLAPDGGPGTLIWAGFDPHAPTAARCAAAERPFDAVSVDEALRGTLAPPADPRERAFLRAYLAEDEARARSFAYPLLLRAAGVPRPQEAKMVAPADADSPLYAAFERADRLAGRYAQAYRSGHVVNFLVGALAVLIALSSLLLPEGAKLGVAVAELAAIALVIANTAVGTRRGWHRRWLDYRQLAERLRPMAGLRALGLAAPEPPGDHADPRPRRWTEWCAAAAWRAVGLRAGALHAADAPALARALAGRELRPQVAYHRDSARRMELLDHRLHLVGSALFWLTVAGCFVLIGGIMAGAPWVKNNGAAFVALSAGLPAVGTALFGLRVQGDFAGTALRSRATADRLAALADRLEGEPALSRAADLMEEAARAMNSDLGEWRLAHQQHELAIPA